MPDQRWRRSRDSIVIYPYSREEPGMGFTSDDETLVFQGDELVERYDGTRLETSEECEVFSRGVPDGRSPVRSLPRRGRARRRAMKSCGGVRGVQIPHLNLSIEPTVMRLSVQSRRHRRG